MASRKYTRLKGNIDIELLTQFISSGNFTHKEVKGKFSLTARQLNYLISKYNIKNNLIIDRSFMQLPEFGEKISSKNTGKIRTEEHKRHYREAAAERPIKNNRGSGWNHAPETITKITNTNRQTYESLPRAWINACLDNNEWYEKLKEAAKNKQPMSEEQIRRTVETKVGMSYDQWQIVRGLYDVYCAEVRHITNLQPLQKLDNIEKRGSDYHLDHMFSICEGFRNDVSPEIIGDITNLMMLPAHDNCVKNKKCSIALEKLLEKYNERSFK